jgi:hypothetical protein
LPYGQNIGRKTCRPEFLTAPFVLCMPLVLRGQIGFMHKAGKNTGNTA